ncbi:hypothetical protein IW261DRAFT_498762 [Armillaria novae-zelandiae]|uniref:Uncharacterized protein n=1 Tax=Armillaria novae-zelandiae TaxID=153914 RepID=A0AA39UAB2_9AGAR|nr:hypothetical protein IW261DRAFT_498762 [Armillaria novae-zelandiae]
MSAKAVVRVLNSLVNLEEIKLQGYGPKIFRKKESMEAPLFKYLFADNRIKKVHLHNCKFFKLEDLFTFLQGFPEMKDLWIDKGFKCPASASAFSDNLLRESGTIYLETLRVISDFKNPFGILISPESPLSLKEMKALVVGTASCVQYDGVANVAKLADGFQKLALLNIGVYEALVTHDIQLNPFPIHQLRFLTFGLNTDRMELAPLLGKVDIAVQYYPIGVRTSKSHDQHLWLPYAAVASPFCVRQGAVDKAGCFPDAMEFVTESLRECQGPQVQRSHKCHRGNLL